jgi:CDP-4-dehydro-6-deoxyglucose reductase
VEYNVTIQPSGHCFTAHEHEPILEAGLRAGHNLKYQCDNGSCGECKARLLSGELKPLCNSDYSFTGVEKDQGYFLPCCCGAAEDLEIEAGEFNRAEDIPNQQITARVRKIEILKQNIIQLQLRTPRTNTLRFLAGQSVTLRLPNGSTRFLQIASCPCNGMVLEFHVRCRDQDEFSDYLYHQMVLNEEVLVEGPTGEFILDDETDRPLLFIAYDTGFSGIKSLIEHAFALELKQDIYLYRVGCMPGDAYMNNICRAWDDAMDNFFYHSYQRCTPIDCDDMSMTEDCQHFLQVLEEHHAGLIGESDIYLSGVEPMMINLQQALLGKGASSARLKVQPVS